MTMSTFTEFFGWLTVLNFGFLLFMALCIVSLRPFMLSVHTKVLGLDEQDLLRLYATYLSNFKIAAIVFSFMPYLALKLLVS